MFCGRMERFIPYTFFPTKFPKNIFSDLNGREPTSVTVYIPYLPDAQPDSEGLYLYSQDPTAFVNSLEYEAFLRWTLWPRIETMLPKYRNYMLCNVWPYLKGLCEQTIQQYGGSLRAPPEERKSHTALQISDWPKEHYPIFYTISVHDQSHYKDVEPVFHYALSPTWDTAEEGGSSSRAPSSSQSTQSTSAPFPDSLVTDLSDTGSPQTLWFCLRQEAFIPYTIHLPPRPTHIAVTLWIPYVPVPKGLPPDVVVPSQNPKDFVNSLAYEAHLRWVLWPMMMYYYQQREEFLDYMVHCVGPWLNGFYGHVVQIYGGTNPGPVGKVRQGSYHTELIPEEDWPAGHYFAPSPLSPVQRMRFRGVAPELRSGAPSGSIDSTMAQSSSMGQRSSSVTSSIPPSALTGATDGASTIREGGYLDPAGLFAGFESGSLRIDENVKNSPALG
jgi:uncharacterized protein YqcC (DUF446 family)